MSKVPEKVTQANTKKNTKLQSIAHTYCNENGIIFWKTWEGIKQGKKKNPA
jgi:hypothetical protein